MCSDARTGPFGDARRVGDDGSEEDTEKERIDTRNGPSDKRRYPGEDDEEGESGEETTEPSDWLLAHGPSTARAVTTPSPRAVARHPRSRVRQRL
ncbi:hypothetical protein HFX_2512 [Haloferax mediterranei ATCC 33500]|uniref:Uncharacterized protein n=1 Tax=Haloferax mediterranei (strain ATCC 33500 / DSM 1411 / JCM 8866 / NBRC 14739 / NCIMB 2177 / R-4) TaxID=523841 RepID=I3R7I3_HALMT|nr:hypothetical protein HFX_2512 [Haloferax mediterranei ATCC 33500]